MRTQLTSLLFLLAIFTTDCRGPKSVASSPERGPWSREKANEWYSRQGWLVGANFIPSNAINQLEMWQPETFDTATINRELGWAESIGMNTSRVFLHDLL